MRNIATDAYGNQRVIVTKKVAELLPNGEKVIIGLIRDITDRKRAELARDRLSNQLQTAVDVTQAVMSILDPRELTEKIVNIVRERFDLYYVGLFLISQRDTLHESAGEYAYLQAATGEAGRQLLEGRQKLKVGGDSMIGQCIASGEPRLVLDVKSDEGKRFSNPLLPDTAAEMVLPLTVRKETFGALTIQSARDGEFEAQDVSIFQMLANQLAIAIENANLYKKIDDELEEVKRSLQQYVHSGWDRYFGKK